jgi:hypothetical protein
MSSLRAYFEMSLLKTAHDTLMLEYTPLSMEEIKLANPEKVRIAKKKLSRAALV